MPKARLPKRLGKEWSESELRQFFESYMKHFKASQLQRSFIRIANTLPERTASNVKTLYKMNRSFLSLPHIGVDTFVAIMVDRYAQCNDSNSDASVGPPTPRSTPSKKRYRQSPGGSGAGGGGSSSTPHSSPARRRKRQLFSAESSPSSRPSLQSTKFYQGYGPSMAARKLALAASQMSGRRDDPSKAELPEDPRITKTINGLSNGLRRFLVYEFFYSGIDRDYFNPSKAEFALALGELNLNVNSLTRTEWSVIRSRMLMGRKPRRLSQAFLLKERQRLHQYRKDVREQQRSGMMSKDSETKGLYNIPAALTVGQRVSALHAGKGNVLAVGSILTCDPEIGEYRVQFDLPELGVEVVRDVDIMPHGFPRMLITRGDGTPNLITSPERGNNSTYMSSNILHVGEEEAYRNDLLKRSVQHASDDDVRLLAAVTPLLKRKELLVRALDEINSETSATKTLNPLLKQRYAWLLVNLEETNKVLLPLMNRFSERFSKGASESWSDSFTNMVARTSRAIARHGGTHSNILNRSKILNSMAGMMNRTNIDRSRMDIRKRIESALRIMIGLRFCAEQGVSDRTTSEALSKFKDDLRPACSTNMKAYDRTCELLDTLCEFLKNS